MIASSRPRATSCGVVVTDGLHLLLGRFTGLALWDIPKGLADPGEDFERAAARELAEETGLEAPPGALRPLGLHRYRPGKDLALFLWRVAAMPDPARLVCRSTFRARDGRVLPKFDAFATPPWDEAITRVGRNLARVLGEVAARARQPALDQPSSSA
ncbi:NUDIX domain-containing protein [Falsiroseomonas bella]|uniref:NUDIX domain-containing protein n=1 Tax=Falsiroseomonas bella TaxID=2184016 RepID=UPI0018EEA115|nr:NUDIX domain-containing protein [Falsiroseomonas bella]